MVFWSFRLMVGLGFWFILLGFWAAYRWYQGELFEDRLLGKSLMGSTVLGILAVELGWIVTEVGRQPWLFDGAAGSMKTAAGVSPSLSGGEATLTLAGFVGFYGLLLTVSLYVIRRLFERGPPSMTELQESSWTGDVGEVPADD